MTDTMLHVGVYQGPEIPQSFRVYADNVRRYLPEQAIRVISFTDKKNIPASIDVLWDIRSGGGNPPPDFLLGSHLPPLVVTIHGFAPVTLNGWEYYRTLKGLIMSHRYAMRNRALWQEIHTAVSAIIAVSSFVKEEAVQFTGVPAEKIYVCHHGADTKIYTPHSKMEPEAYFFHISNDEPRKNISRILRAFRKLRRSHNVELVLKLPENAGRRYAGIDGVRIIAGLLTTEELADLYRRTLAFIFPSLYEGFGMPIVEAMACGCPVITSNVSACAEVAAEAAITVDPRDEDALLGAMLAIYQSPQIRAERVAASLRRAQDFSWAKSAQCHANVLRTAARLGH
jgi:glycosyltransferase involved in cell wall biosynthesis